MQPKYKIYIFLIAVIFCWSCQKETDWRDKSMETLILGKWELVRDSFRYAGGGIIVEEYIPNGYVEFLPEGCFAWYDYQTKIYTLFEVNYLVKKRYPNNNDTWILHNTDHFEYNRQKNEIGKPFGLPACYDNQISFEDENNMILADNSWLLYFIYKRKK